MSTELSRLASQIEPEKTILFFGAGASISSHAPSVTKIMEEFEKKFEIDRDGYSLREYASIIESDFSRHAMIAELRKLFAGLKPTGSLLTLPLYKWKSIYTTNYDDLIEQSYRKKAIDFSVFESNYDFTLQNKPGAVSIFKLHGSINKDVVDGSNARIIISDADYDHTQTFREALYDRLKSDLHGSHLIIVGHSLADEHIKDIANRQAEIIAKSGGGGRITLLMFTPDNNRANIWERRGIQVAFGGIDDLFQALSSKLPSSTLVYADPQQPLDYAPVLNSVTIDVFHATSAPPNIAGMFNGWPATYSDIDHGLTFERDILPEVQSYLALESSLCAVLLGASGVGKTTTSRQILLIMSRLGHFAWEHKGDFELQVREWLSVAGALQKSEKSGVLFVDEAHSHLHEINALVDALISSKNRHLKILIASSRNHWNPRVKTPGFYKVSREFGIGKLKHSEIDRLLNLVDGNSSINSLIESAFNGFSRYERRRRLIDRCESETFVCLKNVFSSEKFDDIILREYAGLTPELQDVYRIVAAMDSSGIRVHRQLVIRLLGIPADVVSSMLTNLTDIIHEYVIDSRQGVYGWKGRHGVIVGILTKYKFSNIEELISLFENVIDSISPTYDVEIRTIRELCNLESGLSRIHDTEVQNRLLRKMMSRAPAERVPRHRLIRNLINQGEFDKAEAEVRIYEKDFGKDAPVARYRITAAVARSLHSEGILEEDRIAILSHACELAGAAAQKYSDNKNILGTYCEVGVQWYRKTADFKVYDLAMRELKQAEIRIGDPQITALVRKYEQRISGQAIHSLETGIGEETTG